MPRKVKVATTCFNEEFRKSVSVEDNFNKALDLLGIAKSIKPDIICFPEIFLETGINERPVSANVKDLLIETFSKKAKEIGSYIIVGGYEPIDEHQKYNSAWLIGRDGSVVGRYDKVYPTIGEMESFKVKPGREIPVFRTDFGVIGIAICYDIGWPSLWSTLREKGAELVIWISAYDGGFPLQVYAWSNFYYIVSSVRTNHSKIVDKTGKVLSSTSRWASLTYKTIDLEKEIFHIDGQFQKIYEIQRKLGTDIVAESFSEENIFTLESHNPEWPIRRIMEEFNLLSFKDYHKEAEIIQDKYR